MEEIIQQKIREKVTKNGYVIFNVNWMKIKILKAFKGDSMLLSFSDSEKLGRNILIDGGTGSTYFENRTRKNGDLYDLPALYLSNYIIQHKDKYYTNLRKVTEEGNWEDWIMYMLDMVEQTALKGRSQITEIEKLMNEMGTEIQQRLPKIYSKDLMGELFRLPYTKRNRLENAGLGNLKTVGNYLKELENNGFLKSEQVGKEKLYLNYKLLEVLKVK